MKHRVSWFSGLALALSFVVVAQVGVASAGSVSTGKITRGGTPVIAIPYVAWPSLDPANSQAPPDAAIMSAIFGQLIAPGLNGSLVPSLATGWTVSDKGLRFDIALRRGVRFTDGTAFNAQAVADNFRRDLTPSTACPCLAPFGVVKSISTPSAYDVRLTLSEPDSVLPADFIDNALNWIYSPNSLQSQGATTFFQSPIGAGPFKVVSNTANAQVTLQRNSGYWEKGHPYLAGLKFIASFSDNADFSGLQSGSLNLSFIATASIWLQAKSTAGLHAYEQASTDVAMVTINTTKPPFNNPIAREALAYATNPAPVNAALNSNLYPLVQAFESPYLKFYEKTVPNYPKYNLAKAKALVAQVPGGITFSLLANSNPIETETADAFLAQYEAAGMTVNVVSASGAEYAGNIISGNYQVVAPNGWNGCDLDPGTCLPDVLQTGGIFSGIKDPTLDGLINQAAEFANPTTRQKIYDKINAYVNANWLLVPLWGQPITMVATSNLHNLPTSLGFEAPLDWDSIWMS